MPSAGLQLAEEQVNGTCELHVHGELDLNTVTVLTGCLEAHRGECVVIDLSELRFCDSSGLRALLGESREARIAGGRLMVRPPPSPGPVRRLLELTGVLDGLALA